MTGGKRSVGVNQNSTVGMLLIDGFQSGITVHTCAAFTSVPTHRSRDVHFPGSPEYIHVLCNIAIWEAEVIGRDSVKVTAEPTGFSTVVARDGNSNFVNPVIGHLEAKAGLDDVVSMVRIDLDQGAI